VSNIADTGSTSKGSRRELLGLLPQLELEHICFGAGYQRGSSALWENGGSVSCELDDV